MDNQELAAFIKNAQATGKSREDIYKELLTQGKTITEITEAFSYRSPDQVKQDTQEKTVKMVLLIGALLIAAGVFSFIAANWLYMGSATKVGVIILAMLIVYGLGWYFYAQESYHRIGMALFLVGTMIYGAGIFLVAQIFNIHANYVDGFLLWMFGTLVLSFSLGSYQFLNLAAILGFVSLFSSAGFLFGGIFSSSLYQYSSNLLLGLATLVTLVIGVVINRKIPPEIRKFF